MKRGDFLLLSVDRENNHSILAGERIYLRPINYNDTDNIVRWRNNPIVQENFIYREPFTKATHLFWMETRVETNQVIQFIICEKATGMEIGSVYLRDIDHKNKKCELGIFIGETDKLSLGYGREAAELVTEYAFTNLSMYKVFLRALANNYRARRSYSNAGFKEEGLSRADVWIDDEPIDVVFMSILRGEK